MEIRYFVKTTGVRKFNYDIEYEAMIDRQGKSALHYINMINSVSNYNSVILEDDLVLCKNFKEEIERVINQYPDIIITFFSLPSKYFKSHITNNYFSYNQCIYFPKGLGKDISRIMLEKYKRTNINRCDILMYHCLKKLNLKYLNYRPCLVQHIDGKSILKNGKHLERNTIYFKDYLDKLNISYEDACKDENKKKLEKLLEADKKVWYVDYYKMLEEKGYIVK